MGDRWEQCQHPPPAGLSLSFGGHSGKLSPSVESGASCELRPCQSTPVDNGHIVLPETGQPNRTEPRRRGTCEPSGSGSVDSELIRPVDVQPPGWPKGDSLRHRIVDCTTNGYRSPVMFPPTSQRDDSIVVEVPGAVGIEGFAEGKNQRGGLRVVAVSLERGDGRAEEIELSDRGRLRNVERTGFPASGIVGPAAIYRGDIMVARSQSRREARRSLERRVDVPRAVPVTVSKNSTVPDDGMWFEVPVTVATKVITPAVGGFGMMLKRVLVCVRADDAATIVKTAVLGDTRWAENMSTLLF